MNTNKQKLGPLQLKWVKALESGRYKQGEKYLCKKNRDNVFRYCCLGVACRIAGLKPIKNKKIRNVFDFDQESHKLPRNIESKMKFRSCIGGLKTSFLKNSEHLAGANDGGIKFKTIAAFVRENPVEVFTEKA